jgi:hypothetical protein
MDLSGHNHQFMRSNINPEINTMMHGFLPKHDVVQFYIIQLLNSHLDYQRNETREKTQRGHHSFLKNIRIYPMLSYSVQINVTPIMTL